MEEVHHNVEVHHNPRRIIPLPTLLFASLGLAGPGQAEPALMVESRITLPAVSGRIDHMAVDSTRKRLFVAELGNGSLDVVDLAAGRQTQRISGLSEPQGVGYAPQAGLVAVASGGDGSVRFYRGGALTPAGAVMLGTDGDDVRIDTRTGDIVVGYGSGSLAIIDPNTRERIGDVRLAAHPEGFAIGPATGRAFVNVPGAREIAVLDLMAGKQVATWTVPESGGEFPDRARFRRHDPRDGLPPPTQAGPDRHPGRCGHSAARHLRRCG